MAEEMTRLRVANKNLREANRLLREELNNAREHADELFLQIADE